MAQKTRIGSAFAIVATLALTINAASTTYAYIAYLDDFDVDSSANWNVNAAAVANGDTLAAFAFDYSQVGIPSAPNSVGGTTSGLKLQANRIGFGSAVQTGLSVSPKLQSFTGDYEIHADVWLNYNVPNGGGSGTTQYAGMGALSNGTTPQWNATTAATAVNSVYFHVTVDGGNGATSNSDYRAFGPAVSPAAFGVGPGNPYSATGTGIRDNVNAFYTTNFPSITLAAGNPQATAPAGPFPAQVGATPAGTLGFQWRDWAIIKTGSTMFWKIDGVTIATIDLNTAGVTSGNNLLLTYNDSNAGKSTDATSAALLFALYDNVRVIQQVPEANAWMFGAVAAAVSAGAWWKRRRAA